MSSALQCCYAHFFFLSVVCFASFHFHSAVVSIFPFFHAFSSRFYRTHCPVSDVHIVRRHTHTLSESSDLWIRSEIEHIKRHIPHTQTHSLTDQEKSHNVDATNNEFHIVFTLRNSMYETNLGQRMSFHTFYSKNSSSFKIQIMTMQFIRFVACVAIVICVCMFFFFIAISMDSRVVTQQKKK